MKPEQSVFPWIYESETTVSFLERASEIIDERGLRTFLFYRLRDRVPGIEHRRVARLLLLRERLLHEYGLDFPLEYRLETDRVICLSGISQAGKTSSLLQLTNHCTAGETKFSFARLRMQTTRKPRDTAERHGPEYDFIDEATADSFIGEHRARRRKREPTNIFAATRYAGHRYFLLVEEVKRAVETNLPIIFSWQREFVLPLSIVFPFATVIELLPEWAMNLVSVALPGRGHHYDPKKKRSRRVDYYLYYYPFLCQEVANLVDVVFGHVDYAQAYHRGESLETPSYPIPRPRQTQEDYHWRLLYAVASVVEVLRDIAGSDPLPMVELIRWMPWGNTPEQIKAYDLAVGLNLMHLAQMSNIENEQDFERKRRIRNLLHGIHNSKIYWSDKARLDPSLYPGRWTEKYGLTQGWGEMNYGIISPIGTIW